MKVAQIFLLQSLKGQWKIDSTNNWRKKVRKTNPESLRIFMICRENPHFGVSGDPFMNSMTGYLFTNFLNLENYQECEAFKKSRRKIEWRYRNWLFFQHFLLWQHLIQFAGFLQLLDYIQSANQLAVDVQLRKGRPVGELLQSLPYVTVGQDVKASVFCRMIVEDRHNLLAETCLTYKQTTIKSHIIQPKTKVVNINQPINQSINHTADQRMNDSINQSIKRPNNHSIEKPYVEWKRVNLWMEECGRAL